MPKLKLIDPKKLQAAVEQCQTLARTEDEQYLTGIYQSVEGLKVIGKWEEAFVLCTLRAAILNNQTEELAWLCGLFSDLEGDVSKFQIIGEPETPLINTARIPRG